MMSLEELGASRVTPRAGPRPATGLPGRGVEGEGDHEVGGGGPWPWIISVHIYIASCRQSRSQ